MDANNPRPRQRETRQSGSPSCPDRIVDRKIERRALPESFSSNLGWKRPTPAQKVPDRSVRAMVTLFEKPAGAPLESSPANRLRLASDTSDTVTVSDGKGSRRDGHESSNHDNKATSWPQGSQQNEDRPIKPESKTPSMFPSVQVSYQVEEYSLTLLKHKSYFNNRPLARCLDDDPRKNMETKIQRLKSRKGRTEETATENGTKKDLHGEGKKRDRDITSPTRNDTSSPVQQLDNLMSALLTWQGIHGSNTPELGPQWERRDPEEVNGFWRNVRKQLWVDEEEIYGERPSPSPQVERPDVSMQRNGGHTLTPSTSAFSIPASYHSESASELPPPSMPNRSPPPIPAVHRGRSFSAATWQPEQHSTTPYLEPFPGLARDYPAWDEPRPTSSVRLSISAGYFDAAHPLFDEYPEPELPPLPTPGRPLPTPPTRSSHSRYPSSGGSGPWMRPPTWRSPSSLRSPSPPRLPPLPTPIPTPSATPTNYPPYPHHRANHSRNRHQPHSSKTSASFSTTHSSVAVTDSTRTSTSGGSRSLYNNGSSNSSSRRTTETTEPPTTMTTTTRPPKTSASSTTTRSTRAGSSSAGLADDLAAVRASSRRPSGTSHPRPPPPPLPRRRLTAEEKLEEIDAFLSPEREVKGGWI